MPETPDLKSLLEEVAAYEAGDQRGVSDYAMVKKLSRDVRELVERVQGLERQLTDAKLAYAMMRQKAESPPEQKEPR